MPEVSDPSRNEKLIADLKVVVADAEEILREIAGIAGDNINELRERIGKRLCSARQCLADAEAGWCERSTAAACCACDCVRENPWQAVGVGAAIGLLLGIIAARR